MILPMIVLSSITAAYAQAGCIVLQPTFQSQSMQRKSQALVSYEPCTQMMRNAPIGCRLICQINSQSLLVPSTRPLTSPPKERGNLTVTY
ncbi:hypothetical protein V8C43DRAFT_244599 [Trichoderma afarasin]